MTVYIVTEGKYDEYSIEEVFLSKEKAEQYVKDGNEKDSCRTYRVEIYETKD